MPSLVGAVRTTLDGGGGGAVACNLGVDLGTALVEASQTRLQGVSKLRVMANSQSEGAVNVVAPMLAMLMFHLPPF